MNKLLLILLLYSSYSGFSQITTTSKTINGVKHITKFINSPTKNHSTSANSPCDSAFYGAYFIIDHGYKYNSFIVVQTLLGATPPYTYDWTLPDGSTATGNPLTGLSLPGTYLLTITDANGCVSIIYDFDLGGCLQYSEIEHNAIATSILSPGGNDGSIQLNPTGGTGNQGYNWTGPNGFSSTSKDINNLSVGTYHLTIQDSGCHDITTIDSFEINPYHFCNQFHITTGFVEFDESQDNAYLEAFTSGGTAPYTYSWTYPNGSTNSGKTIVGLDQRGTYQLIVSDSNGCSSDTAFHSLEGCVGLPDANYNKTIFYPSISFVSDGTVLVDVSGGSGSWTYEWNNPTFYTTDKNIYGVLTGVYYFTAKDSLCESLNVYDTINLHVTSVENKSIASLISAYPNPTSGFITLELENVQSELSISVYNLMGQTVYTNSIQQLNVTENIDLSQYSNGIYFIQLATQEGEKELIKIIKR